MSEEKVWKTWKARWKYTEEHAIDIVKKIFQMGGVRPVEITIFLKNSDDGLDFAIELGWLKDCLNESYKVTSSGLMMLAHRIKD